MNGSNIAGGNPNKGRVENDYYATNPADTQEFLDAIKTDYNLNSAKILEPAAGQGHISKVLLDNYPNSEIISTDLVSRESIDNRIKIQGEQDFLNHDYKDEKFDFVITNPPFTLAKEFIDKSLNVSNQVMMFAKLQFLEGKARRDWFKTVPLKYVYVYSHRANPWRNGKSTDENGRKWSSTMAFAWYVFDKDYMGDPIVKWI